MSDYVSVVGLADPWGFDARTAGGGEVAFASGTASSATTKRQLGANVCLVMMFTPRGLDHAPLLVSVTTY